MDNQITSLAQIIALALVQPVYVRWSSGLRYDRRIRISTDQVTGHQHNGLSAQQIHPGDPQLAAQMIQEYLYLQRKRAGIHAWICTATHNGTDSDGAPTLDVDTIVSLGDISDDLVQRCTVYTMAYWAWARRGYRRDVGEYQTMTDAWDKVQS